MSLARLLADAPAPSADSRGALYGAVALVLTTTIAGAFAYLTARTKPTASSEPVIVYRDPPTTNSLSKEMSELIEHLQEQVKVANRDAQRLAKERDQWMGRAYEMGYKS